jgi:hypothetical protein
MNTIRRRLIQSFVDAGGDLREDVEVERFIRYVETTLETLPPKVRLALEATWRAREVPSYARLAATLSEREGSQVSVTALRQRVSRGLRALEESIRRQPWRTATGRPG